MWGTELIVIAVMIAINSVFAAYELALASVTLARLHVLAGENRRGGTAAVYMKQNLEGSLAGIQLGITLVGAIAAAAGGAGAEEQLAPGISKSLSVSTGVAQILAITIVVAPLTLLTIIFGELIPKIFALRNKELVCLKLSPTIKLFVTLVWPVVWLLERTVTGVMSWGERRWKSANAEDQKTEAAELQELRAIAALARTSRLIGDQEEKMILAAAALTTRTLEEIQLPAAAISLLNADDSIDNSLVKAHLDLHTRFPVTEKPGDPQSIIGYVNFKDIIAHMRLAPHGDKIRKITREITRFDFRTKISDALKQLIERRCHIALIHNSANAIQGMVTLEDIVEELVGNIEDEFDHLPIHASRSGNGWVVGGGVSPARLSELTGITIDAMSDDRTLSDWFCRHHGGHVHGGESLTVAGHRFVVRKLRRNRVYEMQIEPNRESGNTPEIVGG